MWQPQENKGMLTNPSADKINLGDIYYIIEPYER